MRDRPCGPLGARDERGAVYVEFLIAFLPFFLFFLCLWQLSILYYTKLLVDHAAFAAARAAAVVVAEDPTLIDSHEDAASVNKLTGLRVLYIRAAAEVALIPLILNETVEDVQVEFPKPDEPGGKNFMQDKTYSPMTPTSVSLMRVRVRALTNCTIALASAVMCPASPPFSQRFRQTLFAVPIQSEAVFPYQGASYQYKGGDSAGQIRSDTMERRAAAR